MQTILRDFTAYLDVLRSQGLHISPSCFDKAFAPCLATLYEYEIHTPPVCNLIKGSHRRIRQCQNNKDRLKKSPPQKPIYNCCWAGVEEYVLPIFADGRVVMCLNISGYRGKLTKSAKRFERMCRLYRFDCTVYESLSEAPPLQQLLPRVQPLVYMVQALYERCKQRGGGVGNETYQRLLDYICENFTGRLTVEQIAEAAGYSSSRAAHVFKEKSGVSIGQYITRLRLNRAAYLLKTTTLSVAQIASEMGFCDQNHFCVSFKKQFGKSPTAYRKE